MKSKFVAYFLWLIGVFGCLGLHRFYLGKTKTGLLWLISGGLLGVGSIVDLFSLGEQVKQVNSLRILEKLASGEETLKIRAQLEKNSIDPLKQDSYCPYCMGKLRSKPKHDLQCPYCQKAIYFRPKAIIFDQPLLIQADALVVDRLMKLAKFGIDSQSFIQKRVELQDKYGPEVNSVDVLWSLVQTALNATQDPGILKKLYHQATLFLKDLKQDFYSILQRSAKMQLLEFQNDAYTKQVRIVTAPGGVCATCRQLDGTIYSLEDAIRLMPLPCKACGHHLSKEFSGFCRCNYQAVE
ncbi:MAG TPA: hypothetical protein DDW65_24490 [Firmicutes bacterium]|jgi:hypothetical protein|nr:hypothetical protein [Bacillota bacterium]